MSTLEVTFPDEWLSVAVHAGGPHLAGRRGLVGEPVRRGPAARFAGQLPSLDELGFEGRASLALLDQRRRRVVAFCAIGVVAGTDGDESALRAVVEGGRHPGLERDTLPVELELGKGLRSSAFRFTEELLAAEAVPYTAEVRFAFPLPGRRIGVLHFETPSLASFEELETLFDVIAGTARLA